VERAGGKSERQRKDLKKNDMAILSSKMKCRIDAGRGRCQVTRHDNFYRAIKGLTSVLVFLSVISCVLRPPTPPAAGKPLPPDSSESALKMQAMVMDMADDYIASLGESVYLLTRSSTLNAKSRWLAQSFLRNGVGASLDIAVGPNPAVSLLDLLVLTSLQAWSFEVHWIPAGIGEAGLPALDRLKRAETDAWISARDVLSEEQLRTLQNLIDAWIKENRDRTVVALVRFNEFADGRKISSQTMRGQARGLLEEADKAIAAVDNARLLGERLLWFAGRYPYLLGEQTELTAYRLVDQPEGEQLMAAIQSIQRLSEILSERAGKIQSDLDEQQAAFFTRIAAERAAAIAQLQAALETTVRESLDMANEHVNTQRTEAIDQLFDRFSRERTQLLDDFSARQSELLGVMTELKETIAVSGSLARDLTETVNAIDHVVSRFDRDPGDKSEPLRMTDVRDAAIETGLAADKMTLLLERAIALLESESWDRRISKMTDPADAIINRAFWRGVILIVLLVVGMGLLRMVPQRIAGGPKERLSDSKRMV
jgi:nucleotide-binding universal stress UspA family protein